MTPWGVKGKARGPGDLVAVQLPPGKWGPHAPRPRGVPTGFRDTALLLLFFYLPSLMIRIFSHHLGVRKYAFSLSLFPKSTLKHIYLRKLYSKNPRGTKWDQARQPSVPKRHQTSLLPSPPHPAVSTFEKVSLSLPTYLSSPSPVPPFPCLKRGVDK